jgi:hypothetical protein
VILSAVVTVASVVLWQATGGDYYTKFQVVETVAREVDPDDPLAAAGFYDDGPAEETVSRDAFRFGLLPTPQGVFDRHAISVASFAGPLWAATLVVFGWRRWRHRRVAAA